ncbi:ATP-binding protein [Streptomyces sp. S.PNR 29]|uniref:ATP-binding protein n=1 Tax=Streptomyces sp. S.PNR 29 TaxID=2973805 RepID=UPI0025B189A3|nr:ATP-binding protein [Streptomyces sp. S.PNR 29]MDN0201095.1 ATP-binding protein [Streptomyces sp. S.PNR 29]
MRFVGEGVWIDPAVHDSLEEAIGETERLGRMLQGLLSLARLEATATTPEAADLDALVEQINRQPARQRPARSPSGIHHDGTGLGLPIVEQLTRAGGGHITLEAAPGGGLDAVVHLRPTHTDTPPPARQHPGTAAS